MATTFGSGNLGVPVVGQEGRSSASLLRDARNGDREALAQLVMPYALTLYRAGLRLTKNVFDAEDVRQETLLKALSRLEQFSGTQSGPRDELQAWISRIGTNNSIDVIRRRREGKLFSLDQPSGTSEEHPAAHIPSKTSDPERGLLRQETKRQLAAAITALPPDLRQVCLLLDVLQYSTQEVADRLGISNVAVRLRLFRAHRRLREKLSEQFRPASSREVKASKKDRLDTSTNWGAVNRRATPYQAIGLACGAD